MTSNLSLVEPSDDVRRNAKRAALELEAAADRGEVTAFFVLFTDSDGNYRMGRDFLTRTNLVGALEIAKANVIEGEG